jgi:hypothetical protein
MDFTDSALVHLADPATRAGLFDAQSLEQILKAAYDVQLLSIQGPFNPLFDSLEFGYSIPRFGVVEGNWSKPGGADRVEAHFQVGGLGGGSSEQVEAWWRGGIVARMVPADSKILELHTNVPSLGSIDQDIVSDLGSLPSDPTTLEQERRTRLMTRLQETLDQPATLDDGLVDLYLARIGAASVSDLMVRMAGTELPGTVTVTFAQPSAVPPSPHLFPISAAILIRNTGFSLARLLAQSKAILSQVEQLGLEPNTPADLHPVHKLLVVWILSEAVFDDDDWPGATLAMTPAAKREARRTRAGQWLASQGIGLVVTPEP